jgi:hypothetical protein
LADRKKEGIPQPQMNAEKRGSGRSNKVFHFAICIFPAASPLRAVLRVSVTPWLVTDSVRINRSAALQAACDFECRGIKIIHHGICNVRRSTLAGGLGT